MDTEANAHSELNKDQDARETSDPNGPENMDLDSSFLLEVTEYNEVLGEEARNEENTQKTSDYDTTMDLDVANIDKMIIIHG